MKEIVIKPQSKISLLDTQELFAYRELLFALVSKDIKVRYKQTALGILWVIIKPLLTVILLTIFLERFISASIYRIPYPVLVFAGVLFWMFFSETLLRITGMFVENEQLIKKIYFPRMLLPISAILSSFPDLLIQVILFGLFLLYFDLPLTFNIVLVLPLLFFVVATTSFGLGLFLGSLNVMYRDVRHVITFLMQILFFLSPIVYSARSIPKEYMLYFAINPLVGIIETLRAIVSQTPVDIILLVISSLSSLIFLLLGLLYFRKTERTFADIV